MAARSEPLLPFSPLRNAGLFSGHWLENRLRLEPEWRELRDEADGVLDRLGELWKVQRDRVELYGDEQGLEEAFIQPVLRELGWKLKYQTWLQGREPDYALFLNDKDLQTALAAGRNNPGFWATTAAVADSKAWDLSLDRPSQVRAKREYPPEQIEWYLDRSRCGWGILTNGRLWRLVPRELDPQQRRFETYLECNLASLLDEWALPAGDLAQRAALLDDFLTFYLFFGTVGFRTPPSRKPFIRRAAEGSSEYRVGVSEGLKGQTFEALRICIEGFLAHTPNGLDPEQDLERCREQSFILLCRLLFILFAEDRQLLPYKVHRTYTDNRALARLRDDIASRLTRFAQNREEDYDRNSTALWDDLAGLFDLIDSGNARYGVPAYNGGLFDTDGHPFLLAKKMSDWHLARVIDCLGRAEDPEKADAGKFRVDYRDLAIQHLGGIYEGLLELRPCLATVRMVVYTRRHKGIREEIVRPETDSPPRGYEATDIAYPTGSVYLITDKGERRAFGSYYTPDHIVDYIVRQTLGPVCDTLHRQLEEESKAAGGGPSAPEGDFGERVLRLRVLDPAMGSGHFLLRACQYLAEEIATNPHTAAEPVGSGESTVSYWKRRVIENCLYGVDVNPMSVELAKLALWLETVAPDRPLTYLDHHLRHGNSLIGAKVSRVGALPGDPGMFTAVYKNELGRKLPAILGPLGEIRRLPSEKLEQVKGKRTRFAAYARAVEPFSQLADLWCAAATGTEVSPKRYAEMLDEVDKPVRFKKRAAEPWFGSAVRGVRECMACFHWELAFPEVFFDQSGALLRQGFDAIIGNPPYEVLSEKESGQDLAELRAFIEAEPAYAPSRSGKNNLYKLFTCRALDLLAEGGHLGFITPMAILGDKITSALRREMVSQGTFTAIEAFPQKDDPARRIFPEAKLSTAVFTFVKGQSGAANRRFRPRVHPGRYVEESSPGLTLTTADVPLYDPLNFTIVSCDQADWDLATRIMKSGRLARLREFAEFFQGEVNETNERKQGSFRGGKKLVTRGASICLYLLRPASQGENLLLNVETFLEGKEEGVKAFHHRFPRVGVQESSPQNNFRRVIAALIPEGEFCNHKINYLPEHTSKLPLELVLGLLNSKLSDWYFRLGSTNAAVSHYQLYNLPCPLFGQGAVTEGAGVQQRAEKALSAGRADEVLALLQPMLAKPLFSPVVQAIIVAAVKRIMEIEAERGEITRAERSSLAPTAQPYQDLIDQLFYAMAGLSAEEVRGLEERYANML